MLNQAFSDHLLGVLLSCSVLVWGTEDHPDAGPLGRTHRPLKRDVGGWAALPREGSQLVVFLTPAIKLSVPLLLGLPKPSSQTRDILGLSLSACPVSRAHCMPALLATKPALSGPLPCRPDDSPAGCRHHRLLHTCGPRAPACSCLDPDFPVHSLPSPPLLWLSLCVPFCPNSLWGGGGVLCSSQSPACAL